MTKHATEAACLAAARRRWGKHAFIRKDQHAPTPAERDARIAKQRNFRTELDSLDAQVKQLGNRPNLLEAAEFFLAVNGDEPSGKQFREAVAAARQAADLNDLRKATRAEWEAGRSGVYSYKWGAGYYLQGNISSTHVQSDTLEELLEKIEQTTGAKA